MTGASPDGRVGEDGLIEVKCPQPAQHLRTLLGEPIARAYTLQMQWQMACDERKWCDWISYSPDFPQHLSMVVRRVERDDDLITEIRAEVEKANAEIADKLKALEASTPIRRHHENGNRNVRLVWRSRVSAGRLARRHPAHGDLRVLRSGGGKLRRSPADAAQTAARLHDRQREGYGRRIMLVNQPTAVIEQLRTDLLGYLETCAWIRAEGHDRARFSMSNFKRVDPCGTVCCVAGWHTERTGHSYGGYCFRVRSSWGNATPIRASRILGFEVDVADRAWQLLFGAGNGRGPTALARQERRATLLLFRVEALLEAREDAQRPRRERQDHSRMAWPEVA